MQWKKNVKFPICSSGRWHIYIRKKGRAERLRLPRKISFMDILLLISSFPFPTSNKIRWQEAKYEMRTKKTFFPLFPNVLYTRQCWRQKEGGGSGKIFFITRATSPMHLLHSLSCALLFPHLRALRQSCLIRQLSATFCNLFKYSQPIQCK